MNIGLLVLRIVVGLLFAGHGARKLLGMFGGHGLAGTARYFEGLGLRPARPYAVMAGLCELGGGVMLALGLITPAAALVLTAVMTTAILAVHLSKGPWFEDGGYEYNVVLVAVTFALTAIGSGRYSLDHALGLHVAGWKWAVGELVLGVLGGLATVLTRRLAATSGRGAPRASAV